MAVFRRLATALFTAVSRLGSTRDRAWRDAILSELHAIESDRDAASWALGSTATIVARSPRAIVALACVVFLIHFAVHVARQF